MATVRKEAGLPPGVAETETVAAYLRYRPPTHERGIAMRIESAEVVVTSPDRNFVTLRLTTDDGLTGLGDATLNGRELSVVSYLRDHVVPLLIGRDAHRIEDTWQVSLPQRVLAARSGDHGGDRGRGRRALGPQGQGRRDAALPVARRSIPHRTAGLRARIRPGPAELFDNVRSYLEKGYQAIRVQTAVPGLRAIYGVAANATTEGNKGKRYDYEPAQRAPLPVEEDWDTRAYLSHVPGVFEAVRNEFGPDIPLLHDGHHRMTPIQAARLGKSLEPYDLFWLEDCTPAENQAALRLVRQHTHDAARDRRGVQHRVGLPEPHHRAAHRLRARRGDPHGRHLRAAQDSGFRRAVPDQVRHARADRHLAGRHGRRRCTWGWPSTTSASRSTWSTAR